MATPLIRPFRDVSEHFVLNLYRWSGAIPTLGVPKGTLVVISSGWQSDQNLQDGGAVGGFNPPNPQAVSRRYTIAPQVGAANSGDNVLGVMLYDVRELDENGVPLIFNPSKQAQLQAVLSGEAVPIATKGTFVFSGIQNATQVAAGGKAYASGGFVMGCNVGTPVATVVGKFLGAVDSRGFAAVKIDL